jgi:RNA recognition motif-containing protein
MLPKTIDEEDLHNMFAPYGELREVHIIRGPEGSSKGCAFVKFVDRDAAMVAIEDMNELIPPVSAEYIFLKQYEAVQRFPHTMLLRLLFILFYSTPQGSTRPLVVKFADSKKQLKLKDEGGGLSMTSAFDSGSQGDNGQSLQGSGKGPDFWSKQFQLQQQQQQQQMMYSYPVPNNNMQQQQQQQQLLPISLGMPYGGHNNSQQYLYMQQQNNGAIGNYAYDINLNSSGHNGDIGETSNQARYPVQQPYPRMQQQYQSNASNRDPPRLRNAWPSTGGRGDKNRGNDGSSHGMNSQEHEDLYSPLDSNGEISRSLLPAQRPTEGAVHFLTPVNCLLSDKADSV